MKGIIITDIPEHCLQCIVYDDVFGRCNASEHEEYIKEDEKPDWCPIKPIPEKILDIEELVFIPCEYSEGYMDGYNKCIDEILKGENNE